MMDLKDAVGTQLGDCLLFQTDVPNEVRKLDTFSNSQANPAQLVAGFSVQVSPPYPPPHTPLPTSALPSPTLHPLYMCVRDS